MRWLIRVGIASVLFAAFQMTRPMVIRSKMRSEQTSAVNNLRRIGIALFEFETEYGSFPDSTTAAVVKANTGTKLRLTDRTSNDVFVQLLAAGLGEEKMFETFSKATQRPDGEWSTDKTALAHGETGFAIILGSSAGNPSRPVLFGPVIPGTTIFDAKTFDGKAIVLKLDNSVTSASINASGRAMMMKGHELLDPNNPIWGGKAPDVRWPK